ncbi:unnamed protein product [Lymnaea stagnalis]|uniref:Uncharacterized protein n=1 Tax=Lymnaea stagnalis TaxID=6523 RepID=A0AAV2I192_LYMST
MDVDCSSLTRLLEYTDSAEGCGNSPADSGVVGRQNPVCQDTEPAAIERRGDSSADSDSVGRQNVVCQDTQQDYRETHEIATSTSSLKKRFYLNYHETLVTVQLNPVVDIEEMYVMKLDVTDAI